MKTRFLAALIVALSLVACHNHEAEEHHHHEAEPVTIYTEHYELFAEVPTLHAGEECSILAHITRLADFKPLPTGSITLTINGQKLTAEEPIQPGMWKFVFTPKEAGGCGDLVFEVPYADTVEIMKKHIHHHESHSQVGHNHEGHSHEGHNHEGHNHEGHNHEGHNHEGHEAEAATDAITFTKEQSWKVDFATEVVEPMQFGQLIKTTAQVLPSSGDQRTVSAKASGIVVFSNPNIVEGASVAAGQQLFSIKSNGMADNNMSVRFQEAQAAYTLAKQEYERKQQLAEDRIVSQSDLAQAKAAMESAAAIYNNLKGNFSQSGQRLCSPISGYVTSIAVQNGGYVEAGQTVATVSQNRDLFLRAEVQPRHYQSLGHILGASFRLPNSSEAYSIEEMGGALVSYGKAASADDPLIPVTFRIRNTANLLSGSFVSLYIRTATDEQVLTLPNSGIVEEMGTHFVFVQITPEKFEKRLVTLGATDGMRTVITSGLKSGERVVSKGAVMVKLAQGSGNLDPHAGHMH